MKKLILQPDRCPANHPCPSVLVCPVDALSQVGNDAPLIDQEKCIVCGACTVSCGKQALQIIEEE